MAWSDWSVIELRRTPAGSTDPQDADVISVKLAVTRCTYVPLVMGNNTMAADTSITGRSRLRGKVNVVCLGFNTGAAAGEMQSYGTMLRLIEQVLVGPETSRLFLYRAWNRYGDLATPLQYYDYDHTGGTDTVAASPFNLQSSADQEPGETYPYSPAGKCPIDMVLDGDVEPEDNDDGTWSLSFTLVTRTALA